MGFIVLEDVGVILYAFIVSQETVNLHLTAILARKKNIKGIREFAHAPNCVGALRTSYSVFPLICAEYRDSDNSPRGYVPLR